MITIQVITIYIILILPYNSIICQNDKQSHEDILNLIFKTNLTIIPPQQNQIQITTTQRTTQRTSKTRTPIINNQFISTNNLINIEQTPSNSNHITTVSTLTQNYDSNTTSYQECDTNKVCVPFFLCSNKTGTVNTDGEYLIDIRLDESKPCPKYSETCCHTGDTISNVDQITKNIGGNDLVEHKCGIRNTDGILFRITGDLQGETEYGEFPWMIAVLREEIVLDEILIIYKCGGSLIHPSVVLSGAHCVESYNPSDLVVRAGEWDTQTKDEFFQEQNRKVAKVIAHDKFIRTNLQNDIALLFTEMPFNLGFDVNTVCLPPINFNFDYMRCFATGWGKDVFGKEGKYQVILKKLELPMVLFNQCKQKLRETRLGKYFQLHESFVCAGGEIGKDTCRGDGGGPLVCPIPGKLMQYYQSGIIAWGIGCGTDTPGVYASVSYLRKWVDDQFRKQNLNSSYYIAR